MKALHFISLGGDTTSPFLNAIRNIDGLQLDIVENQPSLSPDEIAKIIRDYEILILSRSPKIPDELAQNPGKLKYICYLHGTMRNRIGLPIIQSNIQVTNWGDTSGKGLAETSLTLLLAVFRDLPHRIMAVRNGAGQNIRSIGESISELRVGVYGFGFAGREFAKLLQIFGAEIRVFDPYAKNIPDYCTKVDSLKELFSTSQAVVIHAGLTDETEKSVSKELLASLPDHGIIINTARGAIVDQEALFSELKSGRLRAGLDVLWPDNLPVDHEARQWENLIWTCHQFLGSPWPNEKENLNHYKVHLDNIKAFVEDQPLKHLIDEARYMRMT